MVEAPPIALRIWAARGHASLQKRQKAALRAEVAQYRPNTEYDQSGEGILERVDALPNTIEVPAQLSDLPKSVAELLAFANMGRGGFGVKVGFESGWRASFPGSPDLSYLRERFRTFSVVDIVESHLGIARLEIGVIRDPRAESFITLGITDAAGREMHALSRHNYIKERVRQLNEIASPSYVAYHRQVVSDLTGYLASGQPITA